MLREISRRVTNGPVGSLPGCSSARTSCPSSCWRSAPPWPSAAPSALVRPRQQTPEGELERPPLGRSAVMIAVGAIAAIWAVASLVAG